MAERMNEEWTKERIRKMLERLQWMKTSFEGEPCLQCPYCLNEDDEGHASWCVLYQYLEYLSASPAQE